MKEIKPIAKFNRQQKTDHKLFSTFGPYPAGVTLDDVLDEIGDSRFSAIIGTFFSNSCRALNELEWIPSYTIRLRMINLLFADVKQTISIHSEQNIGKKQFAYNLLNNLMNSHFKDRIRQINQERHEQWLEETAEQRKIQSEAAKRRHRLQSENNIFAPESSRWRY